MNTRFASFLCMLVLLSAACNFGRATIPTLEGKWASQGIDSYQIEVMVISSTWHAQSYRITVRDNQVEKSESSCIPAPAEYGTCKVEDFNPEDYTVLALFAKARAEAQGEYRKWMKIEYDQTYGFPILIAYNNPNIVDGDWSWKVTKFEVVK